MINSIFFYKNTIKYSFFKINLNIVYYLINYLFILSFEYTILKLNSILLYLIVIFDKLDILTNINLLISS